MTKPVPATTHSGDARQSLCVRDPMASAVEPRARGAGGGLGLHESDRVGEDRPQRREGLERRRQPESFSWSAYLYSGQAAEAESIGLIAQYRRV
jgi:hypothetical protein